MTLEERYATLIQLLHNHGPYPVANLIYEEVRSGTYDGARPIKPGETVVDVGANVGFFTVKAAHAVGPEGRVYAFEPNPHNLTVLRLITEDLPQVHVAPFAVWDAIEERTMFTSRGNAGGHSLTDPPFERGADITVQTVTLDDYFLRGFGEKIDFLKVDCEGSEAHVLRGAEQHLRAGHPYIAMELHGQKCFDDVAALLEQHGYDYEPRTAPLPWGMLYARSR